MTTHYVVNGQKYSSMQDVHRAIQGGMQAPTAVAPRVIQGPAVTYAAPMAQQPVTYVQQSSPYGAQQQVIMQPQRQVLQQRQPVTYAAPMPQAMQGQPVTYAAPMPQANRAPAPQVIVRQAMPTVVQQRVVQKVAVEQEPEPLSTPKLYNPEWSPTGIEGGVDANKLPWIPFVGCAGWNYKPLRASHETGMFSIVARIAKGSVLPAMKHLGAMDFLVLSGSMTFLDGPLAGTLEHGVWAYVPAETVISGIRAEDDVEYMMNCAGPIAFLDDVPVRLFSSSDIHGAAKVRGITLVPNTLAECMQPRPKEYQGVAQPLAIADPKVAALVTQQQPAGSVARKSEYSIDTKSLEFFESMPGVGLKVLRVSPETGLVTVIVRHAAAAPPHYHLGAGDFFMLSGHLGYRAGPPEGYGAGTWFYEPAGARHESTQPVDESEDTIYLANLYGPIQFDSGVGTPITMVLSWMGYLQIAEAVGFPLVKNNPLEDFKSVTAPASEASTETSSAYNPEWKPDGIEGGVDANKLPWIEASALAGLRYKPLRVSHENGTFSIVARMSKGTVLPDFKHLGAADFMVLSGRMTFSEGPMAGTLEHGVWGYIPAEAVISGLRADEDVEYVMNCFGPIAVIDKYKKTVKHLFTSSDVQAAATARGITLVPNTLADCMQPRPKEYQGAAEPLAIADPDLAARVITETEAKVGAKTNPHYVDTKSLKWFESMPGVGLKILRVSPETGVTTVMVRHAAAAPPHYHLGASDFFMLSGHLGYRAGPPEGYGAGTWFYEPAGARHESTQPVDESEDTIYLANVYGPIQFDEGVGTDITMVFSWMAYLQMAEGAGFPLVKNTL